MSETATKTALSNVSSVVWSTDDQIAIFQGTSVANRYQVKEDYIGTKNGTFTIVAKGDGSPASTFQTNIAFYPYEQGLECTAVIEDSEVTSYKIIGVTIPSVQTYATDSFPDDSFLMAAIADDLEDHTLSFKNLCGALKLQLKGTAKVKTIELKGNDGEPLSGKATVTVYPDGTVPSITMSEDASESVILDCGEGIQLSEDAATDFLITIPPTGFEKGFNVTVTDVRGCATKLQTAKANSVARSYVHKMPTQTVDTDDSVENDVIETTCYIDHTKNKAKFTSSCNTAGRGWAIADSNPAYSHLVGKPINTAAFFTNKTSQTVTVMKVQSYRSTTGEVIATVTATIPHASKQLAVIYFPEVTLKEGEYLSLFSQEDSDIQFYYTTDAVEDASGVLDNGFYTRLPILYGSGVNWSLADDSCLGWSFGYTNHFASKKITCVGDSITAGSGTTRTYWSILNETLHPESMTGMGVAGSCVSVKSDYGTSNSPLIRRYSSIPESDIITIYMGTNDYGHETPMGTAEDTEDISFYGALDVIITGIQKAHPDAKLVWITPTHRYGFGTSKLLGTAFTYDYLPNGRGYSLNDYVDAIKEVCQKYDVPVIDLFTLSGMDPSLSEVRRQYMPDGLHPNSSGHEKIATIIAKALNNIVIGIPDNANN